jgi:hypothetical protein
MTAAADAWKHRLADVLLALGAGYLSLSAVGGPLLFPYDVVAAVAALGLAALIGDYRARWWPAARYTDREHELNIKPGERSPK